MLDSYYLRLYVYKDGLGVYRLCKFFDTASSLISTTSLCNKCYFILSKWISESSYQYFQHHFHPHRYHATDHCEDVGVQGVVIKVEEKVGIAQDMDYVIGHLEDNERSDETVCHVIQLLVALSRPCFCQQDGMQYRIFLRHPA